MRERRGLEAEIRETLGEFEAAYERRDMDRLMTLFSTNTELLVAGSHGVERRVGADEVKVHFEREWAHTKPAALGLRGATISHAGPVAMVDAETTLRLGAEAGKGYTQLKAGLEKHEGRWVFKQMQLTPAPRPKVRASTRAAAEAHAKGATLKAKR